MSANVLKPGSRNAHAYIFGTSNRGSVNAFRNKVDTLCNELGEGARFRNLNGGPVQAQDAGLDVVGWIPFLDATPGQLIVFGQCKTGTGWRNHTSGLDPARFNKLWMEAPFLVNPVRAYFVAEAVDGLEGKQHRDGHLVVGVWSNIAAVCPEICFPAFAIGLRRPGKRRRSSACAEPSPGVPNREANDKPTFLSGLGARVPGVSNALPAASDRATSSGRFPLTEHISNMRAVTSAGVERMRREPFDRGRFVANCRALPRTPLRQRAENRTK